MNYRNFYQNPEYKTHPFSSMLLLRKICDDSNIVFTSLEQACKALNITVTIANNGKLSVVIPHNLLEGQYITRGYLEKEILSVTQTAITPINQINDEVEVISCNATKSEDTLAYTANIYSSKMYEQLPPLWKFALHHTISRNKPSTIASDKWHTIIKQIHLWLNNDLRQLHEIISKGWTVQEIFGCHQISPQNRYDHMGLLMLLNDTETIAQIHINNITIKTASGVIQNFYKMRKVYGINDNYLTLINPNSIYAIELFDEEDCIAIEERAAIMEYDGTLTREKAEMQALR